MLWRARRATRSLGWTGISALALVAFGAGFYVSNVAPLRLEVESQHAEIEKFGASRVGYEPAVAPDQPELQLEAFYEHLASAERAPDVLRRLHRSARNAGLRLDRGEYRPVRDTAGKILRYQINLPVKGTYPQVRRFLAQSLREERGLALDSVGFQRETSGGALDVQLRMTLFARTQG